MAPACGGGGDGGSEGTSLNPPPPGAGSEIAALNALTEAEKADGWVLLFDGVSFDGWRGVGQDSVPEGHWIIEDGSIKKVASGDVPLQDDGQPLAGGDLMTEKTFGSFELYLEWAISPAGNSGIKYNVSKEMSVANPPATAALGFEYQILDDDGHPDAQNGENRTAGALYDLLAPSGKELGPVGEFNSARIIFLGNRGEHWLNGTKVLQFNLASPEFAEVFADSKYRDIEGFAERRRGHIVLQDHTDEVWFRNIKIRELGRSNRPE
jgi:hypothetical protein